MVDDIDISKIISEIGEPKAKIIESEEEKKQRTMIITFSLVALGLFVVGTGIFYYLKVSSKSIASELESRVAVLRTENAKLLEVERLAISIKKRNQNAISLIKQNTNWSFVLNEFERIVLPGMVVYKIETEDHYTLKLNGEAGGYEDIAKFITAIDNSEMFSSATLQGSNMVIGENAVTVNFSLIISLDISEEKDITRDNFNPVITEDKLFGQNETPVVPQDNFIGEDIIETNVDEEDLVEPIPPVIEDDTQPINNNGGLPTL
jgi:Tfp pilus assembly protein PilN